MNTRILITAFVSSFFLFHSAFPACATTTIDAVNKYAYGANIGWLNAYADGVNGAVIGELYCTGYVYAANVGWINLGGGAPLNGSYYLNNSAHDFGVNQDGLGNLRGYGWGANIGWVSSESTGAPRVDFNTGILSGYVWSANCGWICLSNAVAYVQTDSLWPGGVTTRTYGGNGATNFGGPIGNGSLTLSNNATAVFGTVTRGTANFNDALVIYLDTGVSGFTDTSGFADANDGLRKAISGFDGGANRSTLTFSNATVNFKPTYAIALGPLDENFGGLWQLADGGSNSLNFISSVNLNPTGTATAAAYTFSFNFSQIGLPATPTNGTSFKLLGTYISNTGYRSDEALAGNVSGTVGWNPFMTTVNGVYYAFVPPSSLPLLTVTRPGESVIISWPSPSTGFVLQQNTGVNNAAGWSNYSGTIIDNGATKNATISPPTGDLYFRLKQ